MLSGIDLNCSRNFSGGLQVTSSGFPETRNVLVYVLKKKKGGGGTCVEDLNYFIVSVVFGSHINFLVNCFLIEYRQRNILAYIFVVDKSHSVGAIPRDTHYNKNKK